MSKAQTLATTVSTGNVLADGTVAYAEVSGTPTLATVATTGAYADVSGTPTLPTFPSGAVVGTTDTQVLSGKTITGVVETKVAMGAHDIDLSAGNYFTYTLSGAQTLTVSNVASSGSVSAFVLEVTNGGSAALTFFSGVTWAAATAPTLTAAGVDTLAFFTTDGGTTWRAFVLGLGMA